MKNILFELEAKPTFLSLSLTRCTKITETKAKNNKSNTFTKTNKNI